MVCMWVLDVYLSGYNCHEKLNRVQQMYALPLSSYQIWLWNFLFWIVVLPIMSLLGHWTATLALRLESFAEWCPLPGTNWQQTKKLLEWSGHKRRIPLFIFFLIHVTYGGSAIQPRLGCPSAYNLPKYKKLTRTRWQAVTSEAGKCLWRTLEQTLFSSLPIHSSQNTYFRRSIPEKVLFSPLSNRQQDVNSILKRDKSQRQRAFFCDDEKR